MIKRGFHCTELKPEQSFGAMEGRVDHMVELKILLACDLVDIVLGFAPPFRVMPPVPRFKFAPDAVLVHHQAQRAGVRFRPGFGGRPHRGQEFANGGRGFRHLLVQFQFRIAGETEEMRKFGPKSQHFGRDLPVVVRSAVRAASAPGFEGFLSQPAFGRILQKRNDVRSVERDGIALMPEIRGGLPGGVDGEFRQARKLVFGDQHVPA